MRHHIRPNSIQATKPQYAHFIGYCDQLQIISRQTHFHGGGLLHQSNKLPHTAGEGYMRLTDTTDFHYIFTLHRGNGTIFGGFVQEFFTKLGE